MPKGYLMANFRINAQEIFKEFSSVALILIEKFGENFLPEDQMPIEMKVK